MSKKEKLGTNVLVRLPNSMKKQIKKRSDEIGITSSELIRRAIMTEINESEGK